MSNNSDYIRVDSITDIDPNKLTLSYVGKKFIDKDNNRFSIRFNRESRKMEIVKIIIRSGGKIQEESALKPWEASTSIDKEKLERLKSSQTPISIDDARFNVSTKPSADKNETSPQANPKEKLILSEKKKELRNLRSQNEDWNLSGLDLDVGIEPSFRKSAENKNQLGDTSKMLSTQNDSFMEEEFNQEPSLNRTQHLNADSEADLNINSESSKIQSSPELAKNLEKEAKRKSLNEITRIEEMMKELEVVKNRINSVLINIKSSRIFEITGDPSENQNIIGNLTRDFDVEAFQNLDKLSNYLKELISYPRAINYYTAKFERSRKDDLREARSEKEKLDLVIRWEMQEGFTLCLDKLKVLILSLLNVLNMKSDTHIKQLQYPNQLMFTDAKNAAIYCSQDVERLIRELEDWKYKTT